jgi:hypothetical protein
MASNSTPNASDHCFAISRKYFEEYGVLSVLITTIKFFETYGFCDLTPPIHRLLPECAEAAESEWELPEHIKTASEAVKYLQDKGFVWNKKFQDFIESSLTKEIESFLSRPAIPKPIKRFSPK